MRIQLLFQLERELRRNDLFVTLYYFFPLNARHISKGVQGEQDWPHVRVNLQLFETIHQVVQQAGWVELIDLDHVCHSLIRRL